VRSPAPSGGLHTTVQTVSDRTVVKTIYQHLTALPAHDNHQICAFYISRQYQLIFQGDAHTALLKASVIIGGCNKVLLDRTGIRVRAPDSAFLRLLDNTTATTSSGLKPDDLQSAYGLDSDTNTASKNQTVAIVDAYDNSHAESDLRVYRSFFHLPPCSSANGCFRKVNQAGSIRYPMANTSWSGEIALDLDMVSAICPNCHILLVEANSASFADLGMAVDTAAQLGANVISNSYGSNETEQEASSIAHFYTHPGSIITVSSGDNGYGVQLPAALNTVVAVGGTTLSKIQTETNRGWSESAWSGSGSGCSQYVSKPSWQKDKGCGQRTVADVSAVADPETGVAVYNSYKASGWQTYGGTSASAPIIAGVFALAGNASTITPNYLYTHTNHLNSIRSGSNGNCTPKYLCTAGPGYDGPTGWGTPKGAGAF